MTRRDTPQGTMTPKKKPRGHPEKNGLLKRRLGELSPLAEVIPATTVREQQVEVVSRSSHASPMMNRLAKGVLEPRDRSSRTRGKATPMQRESRQDVRAMVAAWHRERAAVGNALPRGGGKSKFPLRAGVYRTNWVTAVRKIIAVRNAFSNGGSRLRR